MEIGDYSRDIGINKQPLCFMEKQALKNTE